jgi:hypothetical protein
LGGTRAGRSHSRRGENPLAEEDLTMSLKAENLQTFEAFKKANKTAASAIKNNTPFCLYSDVEIPDPPRKPHMVHLFLVVGSPASAITPLLKNLHGGKKPLCDGLCSLEEGKISLTAKSGKLEYGTLKSQAGVLKETLGKDILIPSANGNGAAKKDAEKSIDSPPFGKITYFASYEPKILPLLTEAIKSSQKAVDMDGELKERFQAMDAFSKKIPTLETVKQEFLKVDGAVKVEAQTLQDMDLIVKGIKAQWDLLTRSAKEARKNLVITADDLKAADDLQRAKKIKESLEMAPWLKALIKTGEAAIAWAKVEEDPMGTIEPTLEAIEADMELLGLDTAKQQMKALEEEAGQLQWKSVVGRFKLAQQKLEDMTTLRANLVPLIQKAQGLYKTRLANLPADFDAANLANKGKFTFKSMTDLQTMLQQYREFAQKAVSTAHLAGESVFKLQRADILGTQWMSNVNQDKDIVGKMMIVMQRATQRAIHERDGADNRIKILGKQISELEVILSKTRLRPGK